MFQVIKMKKPQLEDGTEVVKFTRLEAGSIPGKAKILVAEG